MSRPILLGVCPGCATTRGIRQRANDLKCYSCGRVFSERVKVKPIKNPTLPSYRQQLARETLALKG